MASRAQTWQDSVKRGAIRSGAMLGAVALGLGALIFTLLLASYHPSDPSLNTAAGGPARNLIGVPGAWVSDALLSLIGPAAALFVPLVIVAATRLWRGAPVTGWRQRAVRALGGIILIDIALSLFKSDAIAGLPGGLGGAIGYLGAGTLEWIIGFIGDPGIARLVGLGIAALLAIAARNCALDPAAPREKLKELTDEMERLAADPDTPAQTFSERSVAAQTLLINASGNGRLPALYDHLSDISSWRMIRGRATSFLKAERRREAARDWRAIERAIRSGDAGAAEARARLLFAHSSAAVRAELQGAE